jgi:hypothetical protein
VTRPATETAVPPDERTSGRAGARIHEGTRFVDPDDDDDDDGDGDGPTCRQTTRSTRAFLFVRPPPLSASLSQAAMGCRRRV